ncbi:hypothetical protein V6N13_049483 [Hibiscus sabdariffa]
MQAKQVEHWKSSGVATTMSLGLRKEPSGNSNDSANSWRRSWIQFPDFQDNAVPVSPPSKTTPFSSLLSLGAIMDFASGLANTAVPA